MEGTDYSAEGGEGGEGIQGRGLGDLRADVREGVGLEESEILEVGD